MKKWTIGHRLKEKISLARLLKSALEMSLPLGWSIKTYGNNQGLFYYYNEKQSISSWIRPVPPPGYYDTWPLYFSSSHILVKHDKVNHPVSRNPNAKEKNIIRRREEAEKIISGYLNQIRNEPTYFEKIAHDYSDCSSCQTNGDLGWKKLGDFDPIFEKAALSLQCGQVSDVFETRSGFHICKRTDFGIRVIPKPPPAEIVFGTNEDALELYNLLYKTEENPKILSNWKSLITKYSKLKSPNPGVLSRYVFGLLYFFPTNDDAIMYCFDVLSETYPEILSNVVKHILTYTWNPRYWRKWIDICKDPYPIMMMREMLRSTGYTPDCAPYWLDFLKLLRQKAEILPFLNEIERLLKIGVPLNNQLVGFVKESIDSLDFSEDENIKSMLKINTILLEDHEKYRSVEGIQKDLSQLPIRSFRLKDIVDHRRRKARSLKTNDIIHSESDKDYTDWMNFLEKEKMNPLQLSSDLFIELMDFNYRYALSELWFIPSVWLDYWSFLLENQQQDHAEKVLELGRRAVGSSTLFDLQRADIFVKNRCFSDAYLIYQSVMSHGEPYLSAALTLKFKAIILEKGEEEAQASIKEHIGHIRPDFIINAARLCRNPSIGWSIFQLGIDLFPNSTEIVIAAANFLERQRDIRNTRLLLQQSKNDVQAPFQITRRLFEFELDHIAPLDHLNETQKSFDGTNCSSVVLFMQRYRYLNLYPLSEPDLYLCGHFTMTASIDIVDSPTNGYFTEIPPYGTKGDALKVNEHWVNLMTTNFNMAQDSEQQQKINIPHAIHKVLKRIESFPISTSGAPSADSIIEQLKRFEL